MLGVFANILGTAILSITGFYVIKKIIQSDTNILNIKNITLISILSIITSLLHKTNYTGIESLIIFLLNIIIYKNIFNMSIKESVIIVGIMMIVIIIGDIFTGTVLNIFYSLYDIRSKAFLTLIANICVGAINILIINTKFIQKQLIKFKVNSKKNNSIINRLFFIILIIGICILTYKAALCKTVGLQYIIDLILILSLCIASYIFVKNSNDFSELTDEYDNLFSYVQNFEDWIEKEQLNRHEYKNQLAVLYCLTKEKKVKAKITEILEDNINIDDEVINQLKKLPKGGIKGLMYYKAAIAKKKKIKVTADISLETKSLLKKLSEKDLRIVCKLIGIYLDNAIEAAEETRKKKLLIEVYELPNKVCFVFSNTFKMQANFAERNNKGISSKGEGRGNGLYFASKLIKSNYWLESKQEIIDNYYIQQLIIKKEL